LRAENDHPVALADGLEIVLHRAPELLVIEKLPGFVVIQTAGGIRVRLFQTADDFQRQFFFIFRMHIPSPLFSYLLYFT
jgi:hypothetical protein